MTVAKETRFSFFRIVTYLHNKTNVCCTRMKISFFSYIYIFTYLHIYIFTYLHIYIFTKQKPSHALIHLPNKKLVMYLYIYKTKKPWRKESNGRLYVYVQVCVVYVHVMYMCIRIRVCTKTLEEGVKRQIAVGEVERHLSVKYFVM